MKWLILALILLVLLGLAFWWMSRRSASRSEAASKERQAFLAGEQRRREHQEGEGIDRINPRRIPQRRTRTRGDDVYTGFEPEYVEQPFDPTLADDLMDDTDDGLSIPMPDAPDTSWRDLPDTLRETPGNTTGQPYSSPSTPADSTDRWVPSFDDTGRHEPVHNTPDPTPPSTSSWGDSSSGSSHTTSWGDSGTTGGSSGGGHSATSGGWSDSGSSGSSSGGDSGGSSGGGE